MVAILYGIHARRDKTGGRNVMKPVTGRFMLTIIVATEELIGAPSLTVI